MQRVIALFPVAVDGENLAGYLVNAEDVGSESVLFFDVGNRINLKDRAQTIGVIRIVIATFDLVVGLLGLRDVRVHRGRSQIHIAVHPRAYPLPVLNLGHVLNVGLALGGVEIRCRIGQVNVINAYKQRDRPTLVRVPRKLQVLSATQRNLREQLL